MKIKTTMRYHFTPFEKEEQQLTSDYFKKLGPSYIAGGTAMLENSLVFPQKVKQRYRMSQHFHT